MRTPLVFAATLLAACGARAPGEPENVVLRGRVDNPYAIAPSAPLRHAVVWTAQGSFSVGDDDVLPDSGELTVVLRAPDEATRFLAAPVETMQLSRELDVDVFRPRVVIYEDSDGDGALSPPLFTETGLDVVRAVDATRGPGFAALLDLEAMLATAGLETSERYYAATAGRFTPFVPSFDTGMGLVLADEMPALALTLSDAPLPAWDLACGRRVGGPSSDGLYATSRVAAFVDAPLAAASVCAGVFATCTPSDLDAVAPPATEVIATPNTQRVAQCRAREDLEALVVHTATMECEQCYCNMRPHADVYFVAPGELPAWWPCGGAVAYCESDMPIYAIDPECIPED